MCGKFNLKTLYSHNFWHYMQLPWQHTFRHYLQMCHVHLYFKGNMYANFHSKMLFSTIFGIICRYHGNTLSSTVEKCVFHNYTIWLTCVPNLIRIAFEMLFFTYLEYVVTKATHFLLLSKNV